MASGSMGFKLESFFFNSMTLIKFIFYCNSDDVQVVLISAIQKSDSVIHIYSFPLWFILGY